MGPRIDNIIATIGGDSHMLLMTATKEFVIDVTHGNARVDRTLRHVIRTVRDVSTPYDTGMDVRYKPDPSQFMIGSPTIYPACGFSGSLQVGKK